VDNAVEFLLCEEVIVAMEENGYPVARFVSSVEEPDEGNPHVRFCEGR